MKRQINAADVVQEVNSTIEGMKDMLRTKMSLIDTLLLAQEALTHSKPQMDHYPEARDRHKKALDMVNDQIEYFAKLKAKMVREGR